MQQITKQQYLSMIYKVIGTDNIDTSKIDFHLLEKLNDSISDYINCDNNTLNVIIAKIRFTLCDMASNLTLVVPDKVAVEIYHAVEDKVSLIVTEFKTTEVEFDKTKSNNMVVKTSTLMKLVTYVGFNISSFEYHPHIFLLRVSKKITSIFKEGYDKYALQEEAYNIIKILYGFKSDYLSINCIHKLYIDTMCIFILNSLSIVDDYTNDVRLSLESCKSDCALLVKNSFDNAHINYDDETAQLIFDIIAVECLCEPIDIEYIDNYEQAIIKYLVNSVLNDFILTIQLLDKENLYLQDTYEETYKQVVYGIVNKIISTIKNKKGDNNMEAIMTTEEINQMMPTDEMRQMSDEAINRQIASALATKINVVMSNSVEDMYVELSNIKDSCGNIPLLNVGANTGNARIPHGTHEQILMNLALININIATEALSNMNFDIVPSDNYYQTVMELVETVMFVWTDIYKLMDKAFDSSEFETIKSIKLQMEKIVHDINIDSSDITQYCNDVTILKLLAYDILLDKCQQLYTFLTQNSVTTEENVQFITNLITSLAYLKSL